MAPCVPFRFAALTYQAEHLDLMPYPETLVQPMRAELTRLGVDELHTADAVDTAFAEAEDQTMLLVVNSVCGCAAGMARPAVAMAGRASRPLCGAKSTPARKPPAKAATAVNNWVCLVFMAHSEYVCRD